VSFPSGISDIACADFETGPLNQLVGVVHVDSRDRRSTATNTGERRMSQAVIGQCPRIETFV
jgi:hypothetical protein